MAFAIISLLEPITNIMRIKLPISLIRLKKFCSTTQFSSEKISKTSFKPKYSIENLLTINSLGNIIKFENGDENMILDVVPVHQKCFRQQIFC